ncbi:MAG: T9SS type A sorting domain-containing protein, partial [Paludibacter sp.]
IKQMNMEMHQWDVPSVNLLGSLDNGAGHWVTGYLFDANHPNDAGHTELSYAIVPSLYDALNAGKAQPLKKIGTYLSMGSSMPYDKLVFTPDNLIHSFTVTFDIKTSATGVISTFKQGITTGTISINASTGYLSYTSPTGQTITGSTVVNNGQWHKITLSHYYARGETLLYSDNVLTGTKSEKLLATDFYLNDGNAPVNIDYRDWFFYRAGMNADEIAGLNSGLMLKSSLELYAPLDGQGILGSDVLQNLAQSTNVVTRIQPTTINVSSNLTEAAISNPAADVTISGTGTTLSIGANKMVNSVTVDAGAKLDFSTANTLTITGDLILKATEMNTETTSFSANIGSGTLAVGGDIKYLKTIDDQKWYFISLPSDVQISTISGNPALGALGTDWFIKYYDGEQRGISGVTFVNWKMITPTMTATTYPKLNKYQGYIIGLLSGSSEITFTLDKSILSTEASSRNIPVAANNAGVISPTHHGWNLIGQPYLSQYIGKDGSNVSNTTGATAYNIYMSDGTSTYTPYTQATIPDINPMSAYFIQASNELAESGITFGLAGRRQLAPAMVTTDLSDVLKLNFTSTTGTDYTLLTMDNSHTTAYEIGYDLEKWIGTGTSKPQVYTVLGGINYAFNALPMSSVVNLPLAIYTQTTGSTTISVDASKAQSLSKLLLTDNEVTPVSVTDLLVSNYTFTAAAGTNNSRFAITAQRITTDNNVIGNEKDETQFIINNSQLTIRNLARNTTVRVYDALGRMIIRNNAASNTIEIKLNVRGVYTVQLQSGTTISNRKVIF